MEGKLLGRWRLMMRAWGNETKLSQSNTPEDKLGIQID
jgi:hypothetical protein